MTHSMSTKPALQAFGSVPGGSAQCNCEVNKMDTLLQKNGLRGFQMKKSDAIVLISLYDLDSFAIRTLHAVLKKVGFNVNSIFFKRENLNNTMNPPTGDEIKTLTRVVKEFGSSPN